MANTTEFNVTRETYNIMEPGVGRSAMAQGGYQFLALVVTLVVAIVGGAVTGKKLINIHELKVYIVYKHCPDAHEFITRTVEL